MQVIIDIDEETYKTIAEQVEFRDYPDMHLGRAIVNGEVLPQGHGRLIDADELKQTLQNHHDFYIFAYGNIDKFRKLASNSDKSRVDEINNCIAEIVNAPTIVEADKRDKEDNCMFGDYMSPIV